MIVYMLLDPRSREVRYVGQTVRAPHVRLAQHLRSARDKTSPPVCAWIRGLLNVGSSPECVVIEEFLGSSEMDCGEQFWIEQLRACGAKLLNIAPGGAKRTGFRHSEETKAKWRSERRGENAPMYGKRRTDEQKEVFRQLTRARIARLGHHQAGIPRTEETKRRISESRRGVIPKLTAEAAERRRDNLRKSWNDERRSRQKPKFGLDNPNSTTVVVDGREYSVGELARAAGQSRATVSRRIKAYSGRNLTMTDFTWTRNSRDGREGIVMNGFGEG